MIALHAALLASVILQAGTTVSAAATLAERGHWLRARALAEQRVKANPNDAEALWLLAQVRMVWGDPNAALPLIEKSVALDPKQVEYRWQLALVVGELADSANMFRQIGLARRFKREVDTALGLNPDHIPSLNGLMMFYYRAPGIIGGDKKKALEVVGRIGSLDKANGYLAEARLASESEEHDKALALHLKAAEADPSLFEASDGVANMSYARKDWAQAEKFALTARKIDPYRISPYVVLAGIYARQERWADLDAILSESEKHVPDNLGPNLRTANVLLETGKDLPRAERCARRFLTRPPEPTTASVAVARWRLALILEKLGRKPDAIAELEAAVKLDPKLEPAKKDLERLRR
jgi:tetratricopeptide (TPR) repeat protein